MADLEDESQKENFWNNHKQAGKVTKEIESIKKENEQWEGLKKQSNDLKEFVKEIAEDDPEEIELAQDQFAEIRKKFNEFEKQTLFNGSHDKDNAVLSIHAGAGGDDAQDWTEMLMRMFLRYAERRKYHTSILNQSRGGEAGIKSVTIEISGNMAYGNLRSEAGVHRLVRLSPFNADNLRQTSFALVEIVPLLEEAKSIEISPSDLKIDTYRSSGAGGQSVNTTDSAVRITHAPSNIVVTCQNERSQLQNKEKALAILRSKLVQRKEQQEIDKTKKLKGEHKSAEWGNQIRSYVLHPYKMVKDHRTKTQTANVERVLDGDLDEFVEEFLRKNQSSK